MRQKYSPDLPKMLCDALRGIGYNEDKGAAIALECQVRSVPLSGLSTPPSPLAQNNVPQSFANNCTGSESCLGTVLLGKVSRPRFRPHCSVCQLEMLWPDLWWYPRGYDRCPVCPSGVPPPVVLPCYSFPFNEKTRWRPKGKPPTAVRLNCQPTSIYRGGGGGGSGTQKPVYQK